MNLTGIESLCVGTRHTCLRGEAIRYEIETDGPVTLTLSDGRRAELGKGQARGRIAR